MLAIKKFTDTEDLSAIDPFQNSPDLEHAVAGS
jgi:hypothetical protein